MKKAEGEIVKNKSWILDSWWDKFVYSFGYFYLILLALAFIVGFLEA
jgi:hypothetical protein